MNTTRPSTRSLRSLLFGLSGIVILIGSITSGCSQADPAGAESTPADVDPSPTGPAPMFVNGNQAEPIPAEGHRLPAWDRDLETGRHFQPSDAHPSPSDLATTATAPIRPPAINPNAERLDRERPNPFPPATGDTDAPGAETSNPAGGQPGANEASASASGRPVAPRLRGDMSPDQLVKFLASADEDMQLIHANRAGIEDPREARETLIKIVDLKLQASRQLANHADATATQRSEGNRGELQSLSHLAALSDVKAAKELEALAEANISSNDTRLAADSRLVLIGFAIESLQNGDEQAVEKLVDYAHQIAGSDTTADVPALIAMGQAKQVLQTYGHADAAKQIRQTIIDTFAGSSNPDVANMAAQFAGNVMYDEVDKLREQILSGDSVTIDQWVQSVETLIDESADIQTVGYLAGVSVDFESNHKDDFVTATLETMSARFTEPGAVTTREVQTAIAATAARQEIIGQTFTPDLPSLSGAALDLEQHRGKIVLIPFWGTEIPLSVLPIPMLQSIRNANPEKIAIVGVNLDTDSDGVQEFADENGIDFDSFQLVAEQRANIASRFGMVSMPFVVILNADGKVAAIQLSDHGLQANIDRLLDGQ